MRRAQACHLTSTEALKPYLGEAGAAFVTVALGTSIKPRLGLGPSSKAPQTPPGFIAISFF